MTYLFLLLVALFAWAESKRDARLIREGKPIDHKKRWRLRAGLVCIGAILPTGPYECALNWLILLKWALLCIAAGALFSACFRYLLNKRRGKHWAYVAPWSSVYDRVWYILVWAGRWVALSIKAMRFTSPKTYVLYSVKLIDYGSYVNSSIGRMMIHRAGRLAFVCELLLTLAALVGVSKL